MIVRDGERTLPLALSSLLRQTYENWECLCIDDASSDGSRELLNSLSDPRFKLVSSDTPLGRGQARSLALKHISGEYVATLDCDDFYYQDTLQAHLNILSKDPGLTATIGQLTLFDQGEKLLGTPRRKIPAGSQLIPKTPQELKIPFGSMVFRSAAIEKHDYDPDLKRSEDRDFFSRVLAGKKIEILGKATYAYRWRLEFTKVLQGLLGRETLYLGHFRQHLLSTCSLVLVNRFKIFAYKILHRLGIWDTVNQLRVKKATRLEQTHFQRELTEIRKLASSLFL